MTQNERILNHLKTGKGITSIQAVSRWGVTRLSARIFEIREMGHRINRVWKTLKSGKNVVEYSLKAK